MRPHIKLPSKQLLQNVPVTPQGPHDNSYEAGLRIQAEVAKTAEKRAAILGALLDLGGSGTHNQASAGMRKWGAYTSSNNANKLLGEMAKVGLVRRAGTVTCPISGYLATLWQVTYQMPSPPPPEPKKPSMQQLKRECDELRARVEMLEDQVQQLIERETHGDEETDLTHHLGGGNHRSREVDTGPSISQRPRVGGFVRAGR